MDKGSCFHLGEGFDVNIWTDPWIPWYLNKKPIAKEDWEGFDLYKVADLINCDNRTSKLDALEGMFSPDSVLEVSKINLSTIATENKLLWTGNKNGLFSVKSAYRVHKQENTIGSNLRWKALWNSNLHGDFLQKLY